MQQRRDSQGSLLYVETPSPSFILLLQMGLSYSPQPEEAQKTTSYSLGQAEAHFQSFSTDHRVGQGLGRRGPGASLGHVHLLRTSQL